MAFNPDVLNLMQSAQPFLGPTGKTVTQLTLHFADLLSSQTGQKALQAFSSMKPQAQASIMPVDADMAQLNGNNPFALFLILILLVFANQDFDPVPPPSEPASDLETGEVNLQPGNTDAQPQNPELVN